MRVVAVSDLHGWLPEVPPCDLLIIAGDVCPDVAGSGLRRRLEQAAAGQATWLRERFVPWVERAQAAGVVLCWGNHDYVGEMPSCLPPMPVHVLTDESGAADVGSRAQVVPGLSLRAAIAWARARKAGTISIEAGPSTANALYEPPVAVDELLLSTFMGPTISAAARGPVFVDAARRHAVMGEALSEVVVLESSGLWRFARYRRR